MPHHVYDVLQQVAAERLMKEAILWKTARRLFDRIEE